MRRIWILNLSLVAVLAAITVRLYGEWIMFDATHQTGAVEPDRETFTKLPSAVPPNPPAPANWTDIPARNPFSFDRTDIAILEPKAPPAPKIQAGPKPVLFGTMSLGKEMMAMIAPGKPGSRDYKPMRVGETIDGWTIVSISDKALVIKANETEETILMNDPTAQIPREHTRSIEPPPPTVTSVGASAPASSQAAPASGAQAGAGQPPTQPGQRRTITQVTPFGVRQVEVEEPTK